WNFTTYGLLGLAASTREIVGTVGGAFRTYMTEATATNPRASKATARRIFLIINLPLLSSIFYLSCTAQRAEAGSSVWLTSAFQPRWLMIAPAADGCKRLLGGVVAAESAASVG